MNHSRVLVTVVVLAGVLIAGCSKSNDTSTSTTTTTTGGASASTPLAQTAETSGPGTMAKTTGGDAAHGKPIFAANCASCHGATGREGGVGPSLKAEKSRKNFTQAVAWIKNPQPPMPKLYPSPLGDKDVADVAAYVETL